MCVPQQRRRAQNRAAQRAFRERKQKRAQELEIQLTALNEKYRALECSHADLNAAYNKLRKAMDVLTKDGDDTDTLKRLLDVMCGGLEVKGEQ